MIDAGAVEDGVALAGRRAGKDPETSVLDPFCRSHEVPNLFVVDGSFIPYAGGVPTTLTIMANSFRVGDYIVEEAKRGF